MPEAIDHRDIARDQDLFHFQEEAPGMVLWHARGLALCRALEQAARAILCQQDYAEVRSPQLIRQPIWEASGHWQHFAEGMFKLEEDDGRRELGRSGASAGAGRPRARQRAHRAARRGRLLWSQAGVQACRDTSPG